MKLYNSQYHRTIKMWPEKVKDNSLMKTVYNFSKEYDKKKPKFKIGHFISISKVKIMFEKKYTVNWLFEILKIISIKHLYAQVYYLEKLQWRTDKRRKTDRSLVRWKGFTKSHDSWVLNKCLTRFTLYGNQTQYRLGHRSSRVPILVVVQRQPPQSTGAPPNVPCACFAWSQPTANHSTPFRVGRGRRGNPTAWEDPTALELSVKDTGERVRGGFIVCSQQQAWCGGVTVPLPGCLLPLLTFRGRGSQTPEEFGGSGYPFQAALLSVPQGTSIVVTPAVPIGGE
ncbi:hypothetical protein PR048_018278 [Dryococelus australis]|uniref:Chromo domain-containing protein n=1 Tax=Dryococelus australis TaxID=614101 RepID=A0ABQ9HBT4_9NEOP|nr:hypothetical protein PR048_018278 [Dryococelus australis]